MTIFQGYDGEIRIFDRGAPDGGPTYYLTVLFCEMDFSGPVARGRNEETLIMNRGRYDTNWHYVQGDDQPRYGPYPFSFSCRLADTINTQTLSDFLSTPSPALMVNQVGGTTTLYSWSGMTTIDGVTTPVFSDANKMRWRVEVLWDNSGTTNYGLRYEEVYFTPEQQTLAESADSLILNVNGQIYGDVTRIAEFHTDTTAPLAFV